MDNRKTEKPKSAIELIQEERQRQISVEGYDEKHDDEYIEGEMALAAAQYALSSVYNHNPDDDITPIHWPWHRVLWKPSTPERDLVKAGALIVAELERRHRLVGAPLPIVEE